MIHHFQAQNLNYATFSDVNIYKLENLFLESIHQYSYIQYLFINKLVYLKLHNFTTLQREIK